MTNPGITQVRRSSEDRLRAVIASRQEYEPPEGLEPNAAAQDRALYRANTRTLEDALRASEEGRFSDANVYLHGFAAAERDRRDQLPQGLS